ncbi:MAG TPA: hypothetical protein VLS89_02305, partial [Candidatus Nanopelagicales bacterium]|nr:hypothetical protein [Candidatus Nanopelagicales bacterium]
MGSGGQSRGREEQQGEAQEGQAPKKRAMWRKARAAMKQSAWTPLGGKAAAYVAGFFALALVGSGDML